MTASELKCNKEIEAEHAKLKPKTNAPPPKTLFFKCPIDGKVHTSLRTLMEFIKPDHSARIISRFFVGGRPSVSFQSASGIPSSCDFDQRSRNLLRFRPGKDPSREDSDRRH